MDNKIKSKKKVIRRKNPDSRISSLITYAKKTRDLIKEINNDISILETSGIKPYLDVQYNLAALRNQITILLDRMH